MQVSITQYAKDIGQTRQNVWDMIVSGRLPDNVTAEKIGNSWVLTIKNKSK